MWAKQLQHYHRKNSFFQLQLSKNAKRLKTLTELQSKLTISNLNNRDLIKKMSKIMQQNEDLKKNIHLKQPIGYSTYQDRTALKKVDNFLREPCHRSRLENSSMSHCSKQYENRISKIKQIEERYLKTQKKQKNGDSLIKYDNQTENNSCYTKSPARVAFNNSQLIEKHPYLPVKVLDIMPSSYRQNTKQENKSVIKEETPIRAKQPTVRRIEQSKVEVTEPITLRENSFINNFYQKVPNKTEFYFNKISQHRNKQDKSKKRKKFMSLVSVDMRPKGSQ